MAATLIPGESSNPFNSILDILKVFNKENSLSIINVNKIIY